MPSVRGTVGGVKAQTEHGPKAPLGWQWMQLGRWRWQVNATFAHAKFLPCLAHPEALMRPPARWLRPRTQSATTEVVRVELPDCPDTPLIVKRYHPRNAWRRIGDLFRVSRARKAFEMAFFLQANGVPTAVPVAALDARWPWCSDAFLITAEVRPAFRLFEFNQTGLEPRKRRIVVKAFARLIAQVHNLGLLHTDPSLTNFLLTVGADGEWRLCLVDLDGLRRNGCFRWRRELRNLERVSARAAVSARERLVFLAAYCRARRPPLSARALARRIRPVALVTRADVVPSSAPTDCPSHLLTRL